MNPKIFIPILAVILLGCQKNKIDEVPGNLSINPKIDALADSLLILIPESGNTFVSSPALFSDTLYRNLVLTKESNVYVSFIDEGAGYKNSLCWYSYKSSQPPTKSSDLQWEVLFPNISKIGDGGLLEAGYTIRLGSSMFPAGTVICFLLIIEGWDDGYIDLKKPFYYTNNEFNIGRKQQHILFKMASTKDLVIGFEDMDRNDPLNSDNDFNDILFSVSDNITGFEATSFDLSKVIVK